MSSKLNVGLTKHREEHEAATETDNIGKSAGQAVEQKAHQHGQLARVHVLSFLVRRVVERDAEHGIVLGDIGKSAKTVSILLKTFQKAFDRAKFPIAKDCTLRIFEAEKSDATDFRVATFLYSATLDEVSLAREARSLSVRLRVVFERLGSGVKDLLTDDMLQPLTEDEQQLAGEIKKISKSVMFLLSSENDSRETEIRLARSASREDNNRGEKFNTNGTILGMPTRKTIVLQSVEDGKLIAVLGGIEDQTLLALCFAFNVQVRVTLSRIKSTSTKTQEQSQRFQLEELLRIDAREPFLLEQLRSAIATFNSLRGGDLSLSVTLPDAGRKASGKNKTFGGGNKLFPKD